MRSRLVENSESADTSIRVALGLRDDLKLTCGPLLELEPMSRKEVEAIHAMIMGHRTDTVEPGCVSTNCGGYVFITPALSTWHYMPVSIWSWSEVHR